MAYSKSDILALLRSQNDDGTRQGSISLPGMDMPILLRIELMESMTEPSDKTVAVINQIIALYEAQQDRVRELLFNDAMRARQEIAFGDDTAVVKESAFWKRLFQRNPTTAFKPLDPSDPRHPCYFERGVADVDRKVRYEEIYISEPDQIDLRHQFAILHCYPAWEDEHGVSIILRSGIPIALTCDYEPRLDWYDDV